MKSVPYKTRSGAVQYKPIISERDLEGNLGFCLACKNTQMAEPDARKYVCDKCGTPKVYGLEELLMMNLVVMRESKRSGGMRESLQARISKALVERDDDEYYPRTVRGTGVYDDDTDEWFGSDHKWHDKKEPEPEPEPEEEE